jgi:glutamate synthase (NADPH/NADH) large chain
MTELTLSATNGQAAQTKATAVKRVPLRTDAGMAPQGLYHPRNEHDGCGVGFIAQMKNEKSN